MKKLGSLIREIRKSKGVTATFLANKLHVSTSTVWKIEHDMVRIKFDDVVLIADLLGVDVQIFFDNAVDKNATHEVLNHETA